MRKFLIIVEGVADKKFLLDYYQHLFHEKAPLIHLVGNSEMLVGKSNKRN